MDISEHAADTLRYTIHLRHPERDEQRSVTVTQSQLVDLGWFRPGVTEIARWEALWVLAEEY